MKDFLEHNLAPEVGDVVMVRPRRQDYGEERLTGCGIVMRSETYGVYLWGTGIGVEREPILFEHKWYSLYSVKGLRFRVEPVGLQWGNYALRLFVKTPWWKPFGATDFLVTTRGFWRKDDDRAPLEGLWNHESSMPARVKRSWEDVIAKLRASNIVVRL